MKSETISIERGGRAIFGRRWAPDGAPRVCVQIAHGLAEHSARYERLALALTKAGYVVTASDHRGHGPNCPPTDLGFFADANGWRECVDDLQAVARRIAADFPGRPLVFFGHSMGSFMGQTHIAEHGAGLAGAVLSGTSGPPAAMLPIGRRIAGFERWRLGPRGKSLSGARDPVGGKLQGLIDVYRAAGLTRVTTKIYPDARHETLNETNRDEVTADLVAWLDGNVR
jgi:alpha-beta hydrolase superfamily lysophospholipase